MTELEPAVHFDRMNKVVEELLKGNTPTQIATATGFKRAEVVELIDEWKQVVHNDVSLRGRAKEAISGADQHYAMLIKEAWKTVEDADTQGQLNVKAGALKLIADIETKRITMLQAVGVLENNEIASQIAETERKQEILVGILKEVTAGCPKCKLDVAKRLSQITGIVESVVVEESDVV
jgi:biotin synthase-related radical SAM superfamily protein